MADKTLSRIEAKLDQILAELSAMRRETAAADLEMVEDFMSSVEKPQSVEDIADATELARERVADLVSELASVGVLEQNGVYMTENESGPLWQLADDDEREGECSDGMA